MPVRHPTAYLSLSEIWLNLSNSYLNCTIQIILCQGKIHLIIGKILRRKRKGALTPFISTPFHPYLYLIIYTYLITLMYYQINIRSVITPVFLQKQLFCMLHYH